MSDPIDFVSEELAGHKAALDQWINDVNELVVSDSKKRVNERFVSDCHSLKTYIDKCEVISTPDLCDFTDRRNSLEIQYENIMQGKA